MKDITDLTAAWAGQRGVALQHLNQTGSTNDDAKAAAMSEEEDLVLYLTAHQTSGRGRGSHHWLDTGAGESLLSTWSVRAATPPQAITGPRIGLALFNAASRTWPSLEWGLKAPNDLYLEGLKVAGLLVESVSSGQQNRLLIGLGLNVNNHPRAFNTATHLAAGLGRSPEDGEWFRFLDEWRLQIQTAVHDCLKPVLERGSCQQLKEALNANRSRPYEVHEVTPQGDLIHAHGRIKWMDI